MERTKKIDEKAPEEIKPEVQKATPPLAEGDGRIWYRKVGGGSMRIFKNKIVKPGERFRARPDEIPAGFRDLCLPLESVDIPAQKEVKPLEISKPAYTLQPRGKNNLWFDVVDKNGKVLNDSALKKEVAEKLIADLLR